MSYFSYRWSILILISASQFILLPECAYESRSVGRLTAKQKRSSPFVHPQHFSLAIDRCIVVLANLLDVATGVNTSIYTLSISFIRWYEMFLYTLYVFYPCVCRYVSVWINSNLNVLLLLLFASHSHIILYREYVVLPAEQYMTGIG